MKTKNINIRIVTTLMLLFMTIAYQLQAQSPGKTQYPIVGDTLPDHEFYDLVNYPTKTAKISDFRGKWLILDFWGYSCSGCIASFPKVNKLHEQFKDKVQFILVGATKGRVEEAPGKIERITKAIFKKKKEQYHMTITNAYDSVLYLKHDVGALPQIFVLDPSGVIRVKTSYINEQLLSDLLAGGKTDFERSYSRTEPRAFEQSYNNNLPVLTNGAMSNGGNDTSYLFRSLLTISTDSMPLGSLVRLHDNNNKYVKSGKLEVFQYPLEGLYRLAYFGISTWSHNDPDHYENYAKKLILKLSDTSMFELRGQKNFTYSLTVPREKSNPEHLMKIMQGDLENYFGLKVLRLKQKVPVYYIEVADEKTFQHYLSTKSTGPVYNHVDEETLNLLSTRNMPIADFFTYLIGKMYTDDPIYNATGKSGLINIDFKANIMDPDDIKNNLKNYGLKIVKGWKELETITISDPVDILVRE